MESLDPWSASPSSCFSFFSSPSFVKVALDDYLGDCLLCFISYKYQVECWKLISIFEVFEVFVINGVFDVSEVLGILKVFKVFEIFEVFGIFKVLGLWGL